MANHAHVMPSPDDLKVWAKESQRIALAGINMEGPMTPVYRWVGDRLCSAANQGRTGITFLWRDLVKDLYTGPGLAVTDQGVTLQRLTLAMNNAGYDVTVSPSSFEENRQVTIKVAR